jgi:hypothetical protein
MSSEFETYHNVLNNNFPLVWKRFNPLKYCDMHAVGQQSTVETLFITIATHATMERTVVFYGVWSGTTMWKCFLWGPAQSLYN